MVTLTREAVRRVATALITLNTYTTTLDVKLALRKLGFSASQDEVRNFMLDITSGTSELVYTDNGTFRTYSFRTPLVDQIQGSATANTVLASAVASAASTLNTISGTTTTTPVAPVAPTIHRDDIPATYTVKDAHGYFGRTYTNVTRAQAKRLWVKATGFRYTTARTTKAN
jgi:hypothetical protein